MVDKFKRKKLNRYRSIIKKSPHKHEDFLQRFPLLPKNCILNLVTWKTPGLLHHFTVIVPDIRGVDPRSHQALCPPSTLITEPVI